MTCRHNNNDRNIVNSESTNLEELVSVGWTKPLRVDLPDQGVKWFRVSAEKSSVENGLGIGKTFDLTKLGVEANRRRSEQNFVSILG